MISPFYIAHDNQRFGACKLFNSHLAKWIPNLLINICQEGEKFRQLVPARNKGCPLFWSCGCKMPLFRPLARPDHLLFRWLPRANFHSYLALLFFFFLFFLQSWVQHNDSPLPIGTFFKLSFYFRNKTFLQSYTKCQDSVLSQKYQREEAPSGKRLYTRSFYIMGDSNN